MIRLFDNKRIFTIALLFGSAILCSCGRQNEAEKEMAMGTETVSEALTETEPQVIVVQETTEKQTIPEETTVDYKSLVIGLYVMADSLNVRDNASTESISIGKLSEGEEVEILEEGEWDKILYLNGIGYVKSEYLTADKDWKAHLRTKNGYSDGEAVGLNSEWKYADFSEISSGSTTMYVAKSDRKNIIVGINAGHGTSGSYNYYTWCHPDKSPKTTGGTTAAGSEKAVSVSGGMSFNDGTAEAKITLKEAIIVKDILLSRGYDVLMIRESDDVQLDNVARTVICNNVADCHIAIHWDGDGLSYDKGCFYMSVPDSIKYLPTVASTWESSERLGNSLIQGLSNNGCKIMGDGCMDMDLTQTAYSTVPSVDIELGNQSSDHSEEKLYQLALGLANGVDIFFGN